MVTEKTNTKLADRFSLERKVIHQEWNAVTIPARDFFMLFEGWFREDDEGESPLKSYDYHVRFNFENGTMTGDEMWGVRNGRVWTSSNASGVMDWNDEAGQYVSHVYFRETKLGAFVSAEFTLDDGLKNALEKIG